MIESEHEDLFAAVSKSLDEGFKSDLREKRIAFVEESREHILRLMGFPGGLPDLDEGELNRAHYFEGMEDELFLRVWTRGKATGPRLLQVATAEVSFGIDDIMGFDSIVVRRQSLALQAFTGSTYEYAADTTWVPAGSMTARSSVTRREAGIPPRGNLTDDDQIAKAANVKDPLHSFPKPRIDRLRNFRTIPPEEEMEMRRQAEENLLPILRRLDRHDLRNV